MNALIEELEQAFPGVMVCLPTEGRFYAPGVISPTASASQIRVLVLGMIDEQKYKDPFLLASGKGLTGLIKHVAPEVENPEDLCGIDIEVILLATRLVSYGPSLSLTHKCTNPEQIAQVDGNGAPVVDADGETVQTPKCVHENKLLIDLQEHILKYGPLGEDTDFTLVLPKVGQTVSLMPTPYRTEIKLLRYSLKNRREIDDVLNRNLDDLIQDDNLFDRYEELLNMDVDLRMQTILDCIVSVTTKSGKTVTSYEEIGQWLYRLPHDDLNALYRRVIENGQKLQKLSQVDYSCEQCGHVNSLNLQMNPEVLFLPVAEDSPAPQMSLNTSEKKKATSKTHLKGLQR